MIEFIFGFITGACLGAAALLAWARWTDGGGRWGG